MLLDPTHFCYAFIDDKISHWQLIAVDCCQGQDYKEELADTRHLPHSELPAKPHVGTAAWSCRLRPQHTRASTHTARAPHREGESVHLHTSMMLRRAQVFGPSIPISISVI